MSIYNKKKFMQMQSRNRLLKLVARIERTR